ncbi:3-deoxy-7-phosphoheptulonate synthase [Kiritimatiella glycovorans]|uniref:Phospho-2-dehydro-3-deoxyheptonate aldolase n=1 Tax=Kiritimatiella glycovorans TaxID=1307763 RepID=A0A0G3ECP5_9BACT|nr:3-deoxy-7-phosphoheptulonate synthase [Kiritimatiella glycovorans]AKJ64276.1 Phospho-2-dehydro-3-deoxyheptonate aldolase [Kiritimatiella glycovorans]
MIIVFRKDASDQQIEHVIERVEEWGLSPNVSRGTERTIVGVIGDEAILRSKPLEALPGVEHVMPVLKPYKRASAEMRPERTRIRVPAVHDEGAPLFIGGTGVVLIAGPCAVENYDLMLEVGRRVKAAGAHMLRGGAFKPRTSPYSFQGLGREGLEILRAVRGETGLPVVTEVMDTKDVELVSEYADLLQIGARNMQNFTLLKEAGRSRRPVVLKRGMANTIEEWLMSAEYIMNAGNEQVILCERGIRTIETLTRNTLDLSAVPVVRRESHLPVMVDPSHGCGHADLVPALVRGAIAAGADAVMVEVHPDPERALSDGPQSLRPAEFERLVEEAGRVARAVERSLEPEGK